VPKLSNPQDTSYFDDFSNPNDMAMYQEVRDRQAQMEETLKSGDGGGSHGSKARGIGNGHGNGGTDGLRAAFVGFTFKHRDARKFDGNEGMYTIRFLEFDRH
jgi:cell cycle protein kinase DBF2